MGENTEKLRNVVWLTLLLGAFIHVPLSVFGVKTQFAALDILLPILVGYLMWKGVLKRPSNRVLINGGAVISCLVLHSIGVAYFGSLVQYSWLLKETLKAVILVFEFFLLMILFQHREFRSPALGILIGFLIIALISIGLLATRHLVDEPFFFARTVYCVALACLLFLVATNAETLRTRGRRVLFSIASLSVTAVSLIALSKGIAGLVLAMMTWLICCRGFSQETVARKTFTVSAIVGFTIFGVFLAQTVGENLEILHRLDSIERSITVRLSLWSVAFEAFVQHFPWGFGLGQFWRALVMDVNLAREGHRFVHNSFLSMVTELGLLGLVSSTGLIWIFVSASRGWPTMIRPIFALLFFFPLFFHDGHSIRMLMIVTVLGLSNFSFERRGAS